MVFSLSVIAIALASFSIGLMSGKRYHLSSSMKEGIDTALANKNTIQAGTYASGLHGEQQRYAADQIKSGEYGENIEKGPSLKDVVNANVKEEYASQIAEGSAHADNNSGRGWGKIISDKLTIGQEVGNEESKWDAAPTIRPEINMYNKHGDKVADCTGYELSKNKKLHKITDLWGHDGKNHKGEEIQARDQIIDFGDKNIGVDNGHYGHVKGNIVIADGTSMDITAKSHTAVGNSEGIHSIKSEKGNVYLGDSTAANVEADNGYILSDASAIETAKAKNGVIAKNQSHIRNAIHTASKYSQNAVPTQHSDPTERNPGIVATGGSTILNAETSKIIAADQESNVGNTDAEIRTYESIDASDIHVNPAKGIENKVKIGKRVNNK